jgi:hypothetical protein
VQSVPKQTGPAVVVVDVASVVVVVVVVVEQGPTGTMNNPTVTSAKTSNEQQEQ